MSDELEIFKKKLLYRSAYRGTKEMDILLSSFVKKYINNLTDNQLKQLEIFLNYGFIPNNFFYSDFSLDSYFPVFSSMFLHGGLAHIAGNMLYLWIFGDNVEDSMGKVRFTIFYLSCGVIAALAQGLVDPSSNIPMVGASGAIAGGLGAYLLLYPKFFEFLDL